MCMIELQRSPHISNRYGFGQIQEIIDGKRVDHKLILPRKKFCR